MKKIDLVKNPIVVLFFIAACCINMGMGGEKTNVGKGPAFSHLEEGLKSYRAIIVDEGKSTEVKDISIGGKTTFFGIRREHDNATMEIDFEKIKELQIKNNTYHSERFSDKEFVLIDCIMTDGSTLSNLLFPREFIISAVGLRPDVKLSWSLPLLQKIVFQGLNQPLR